jgi:hypothetical protein
MEFATQYFVDNFKTKSIKVTFTFGPYIDEWDPLYLASISSLYRDIPECDTFDVNERHTILDMNTAHLFHNMLPVPCSWHSTNIMSAKKSFLQKNEEDGRLDQLVLEKETRHVVYSLDAVYRAIELCNFLGIKANTYIVREQFSRHRKMFDEASASVLDVIPYHQMFEKLNYEVGINKCEAIFKLMFDHWSNRQTLEWTVPRNKKNLMYGCIVQAYVKFATQTENLSTEQIVFLREQLGWEDITERYGVSIPLIPDSASS